MDAQGAAVALRQQPLLADGGRLAQLPRPARQNPPGARHGDPLERHADVVKQSTVRKSLDLGLRHYSREDLEAARRAGQMLQIHVLGLASIALDVTPELARATIASVVVLGSLHASPAVKDALADRMR